MKQSKTKKITKVANDDTILIDPSIVRFTHARIRPFFSGCGRLIMSTIEDIITNKIDLENLPMITILQNGDFYFSLNNRRLFVLKYLREHGHLEARNNQVRVRTKAPLPREIERYTIDRCSLTAKMMISKTNKIKDTTDDDDNSTDEDDMNYEMSVPHETDDHILLQIDKISINKEIDNLEVSTYNRIVENRDNDKKETLTNNLLIDNNNNNNSNNKKSTIKKSSQIKINDHSSLPIVVLSQIKTLTKLIKNNKLKPVDKQINIWLNDGSLENYQLAVLYDRIGYPET